MEGCVVMNSITNQNGGSRIGTAVTLFFFLFVALLAFAVGTFVGKSVSDSEYREAALERGDYKDFRAPASTDADAEKDSESLKPEEVEELKNAFLKSQEAEHAEEAEKTGVEPEAGVQGHRPAQGAHKAEEASGGYRKISSSVAEHGTAAKEAEVAPHTAEKADTHHPASGSTAANRVADGKAPSANMPAPRKPSSMLPGFAQTAVGKFTVQIASYATEKEAEVHAKDLKDKGFSAFYIPADVNKQTWYRVSVGLFSNQKSAATFRKQLMREAKIETAIIQKIVQ